MPIVSQNSEIIETRENESVLARFIGVDAVGRNQRQGTSRFVNLAAVSAALTVLNWTEQLRQSDFRDLLKWVQDLNDPALFDFTNRDINLEAGEEFLMQWFAGAPGDNAITIAWWLLPPSLNTGQFNTIRDRVPFTGDQGATIKQKATFLFQAEPWWDVIVVPD